MSDFKLTPVTKELFNYLENHSLLAHPILDKVARETSTRDDSIMQIPRHQGGFMHMLVKLLGVKNAVEIGCYTGYSAIAVASALPPDGMLTAFDVDPETIKIANGYFSECGLARKIQLIAGDAKSALSAFIKSRDKEVPIDLVFVDADKVSYDVYYELCLKALKPNGLMIIDNAFRDGLVLSPPPHDEGTKSVERLSRKIKADPRVEATMIPIADGLYMVRKKSVTIRPVTREDNEAVAALIRAVMPEFGASGPGFAIHDPEVSGMFEAYHQPRSAYFVLESEGRVVGGGGIAPLAGAGDTICELRKMYFLPAVRGLGYGQKLLDLCLGEALKLGFESCYIETLRNMTGAIQLYERNGFTRLAKPLGATGHFGCDTWYVRKL